MSDENNTGDDGKGGISITLGKLIAYPVGGLLILAGLVSLVLSVAGGVLILLAGIIALPIVRSRLKRSRGIAINRWATVGLVVVLVIAGSVALAGSGGGGGEDITENEGPEQLTHQMGESFTVGGDSEAIEYTVQNVYTTNVIYGFKTEQTDEQFVIIEIAMENMGDETVDISTRHLQVVDSQDRQFDVDTSRTRSLDRDPRIQSDPVTFESLQPGISTQGVVAFEVPSNETRLRFKIEPTGIFSNADEHFVELELGELEQ